MTLRSPKEIEQEILEVNEGVPIGSKVTITEFGQRALQAKLGGGMTPNDYIITVHSAAILDDGRRLYRLRCDGYLLDWWFSRQCFDVMDE